LIQAICRSSQTNVLGITPTCLRYCRHVTGPKLQRRIARIRKVLSTLTYVFFGKATELNFHKIIQHLRYGQLVDLGYVITCKTLSRSAGVGLGLDVGLRFLVILRCLVLHLVCTFGEAITCSINLSTKDRLVISKIPGYAAVSRQVRETLSPFHQRRFCLHQ